jgi:hypothetical protein
MAGGRGAGGGGGLVWAMAGVTEPANKSASKEVRMGDMIRLPFLLIRQQHMGPRANGGKACHTRLMGHCQPTAGWTSRVGRKSSLSHPRFGRTTLVARDLAEGRLVWPFGDDLAYGSPTTSCIDRRQRRHPASRRSRRGCLKWRTSEGGTRSGEGPISSPMIAGGSRRKCRVVRAPLRRIRVSSFTGFGAP